MLAVLRRAAPEPLSIAQIIEALDASGMKWSCYTARTQVVSHAAGELMNNNTMTCRVLRVKKGHYKYEEKPNAATNS